MSSGILSGVITSIEEFVSLLSEVISNQSAFLKWGGTIDLTTPTQISQ
jgi:hypothetical protein